MSKRLPGTQLYTSLELPLLSTEAAQVHGVTGMIKGPPKRDSQYYNVDGNQEVLLLLSEPLLIAKDCMNGTFLGTLLGSP